MNCGNCGNTVVVDCETNEVIVSTNGIPGPPGPQGPTGPSGPAIVDTGSFGSPIVITSTIAIPVNQRARIFIKGASGGTTNPTLGNGTGTQELWLLCVSTTDFVQLPKTQSNVVQSGGYHLVQYSEIYYQWIAGANVWLEGARNEI